MRWWRRCGIVNLLGDLAVQPYSKYHPQHESKRVMFQRYFISSRDVLAAMPPLLPTTTILLLTPEEGGAFSGGDLG